jgi:hypothetical protein
MKIAWCALDGGNGHGHGHGHGDIFVIIAR